MLGEAGDVAGYGLEPVQAVLSGGELDHAAANAVHGNNLEGVLPGSRDQEELLIKPGCHLSEMIWGVFDGYRSSFPPQH